MSAGCWLITKPQSGFYQLNNSVISPLSRFCLIKIAAQVAAPSPARLPRGNFDGPQRREMFLNARASCLPGVWRSYLGVKSDCGGDREGVVMFNQQLTGEGMVEMSSKRGSTIPPTSSRWFVTEPAAFCLPFCQDRDKMCETLFCVRTQMFIDS